MSEYRPHIRVEYCCPTIKNTVELPVLFAPASLWEPSLAARGYRDYWEIMFIDPDGERRFYEFNREFQEDHAVQLAQHIVFKYGPPTRRGRGSRR